MAQFKKEMLRAFSPRYYYNLFSKLDIAELEAVLDYARGLVIKDMDLAERHETDETMRAADKYIRSIDGTGSDSMDEIKRKTNIASYVEKNAYYAELYNVFGINPYDSRQANDYRIIKATNRTLNGKDEATFRLCYNEALDYMLKVTYTDAFSNQEFSRDFFNMYLLFTTVLKFINRRMHDYFDVDTYNAETLKNGFISWGFDYFDDVPLEYQRRIYKLMNDLVRNKGTDNVFNIIQNIFANGNVTINKYILVKRDVSSTKQELEFYRVPIGETLDVNKHEILRYDDITDPDPYWRSSKEEIMKENFNVMDTKYISADAEVNHMKNARDTSFLVSLLNDAELIDNERIKENKGSNILSREEARRQYGFVDDTFYFKNTRISPKNIYLYDAIIALKVLIFDRIKWSEHIHRVNKVKGVYAFNQSNQLDIYHKVKEIREYLYWNRKRFSKNDWVEIMNFLAGFRLKGLEDNHIPDLEEIIYKFKSSAVFKNQVRNIYDYIYEKKKTERLKNYLDANAHYEVLEYLSNELLTDEYAIIRSTTFDSNRNGRIDYSDDIAKEKENRLELGIMLKYPHLLNLLSEFVQYQLACGYIDKNRIYNIMTYDYTISSQINTFIARMGNKYGDLNRADREERLEKITQYLHEVTPEERFKAFYGLDDLRVFLTLAIMKKEELPREILSYTEFKDVFLFNNKLRNKLESWIEKVNDPELYFVLKELWDVSFVKDFDMEIFKGNHTKFSEYLAKRDPELYKFTRITNLEYDFTPNNKNKYRDRIFLLVEAIDNFVEVNQALFIQNSFVGISSYIKNYVMTLLTIFKAYTTELIDRSMTYRLSSEYDNRIRVMDSLSLHGSSLFFTDDISLVDGFGMVNSIELEDNKDKILLKDSVEFTITDN